MKKLKQEQGITLIALVITMIVLLILAGITLKLVISEDGIIKKAQESKIEYSKQEAREKLELILLNMQADKAINSQYNQDSYLTKKIQKNGMIVEGDIVYVDSWKFKIDRSVPKVIENIGETETATYKKENLLVYLDGEDAPVNNVWKDRSGNNNDAVMSGIYTYNIENKSYEFTKEKGQGKIKKFNYTQGITISSRVKINSENGEHRYYVGNGYYGGDKYSRPTLGFNTNFIQIIGGTDGGAKQSHNALTNTFYTVCMTIDKSGNGKAYINGKLIKTAKLSTGFPATPTNDFRIRGYGYTNNSDHYNYSLLPISINNVLVYDRELTQDEVEYIYKVDKIKY